MLAASGWSVVIHFGKNRKGAEETAAQCAAIALDASKQAFPTVGLDLANKMGRGSGMALLAASKAAAFGDPTSTRSFAALVNNAGVYIETDNNAADQTEWEDVWSTTIAINLTAAGSIARAFAADMGSSGAPATETPPAAASTAHEGGGAAHTGTIVNITSRGAFRGEPDAVAYGATKAGLNSITQSLAKSFGSKGVALMGIAPGFVNTPMAAAALSDGSAGDAIKAQSPFGRVASVADVARTVVFLADGKSHFLSGTIVDVNGASHFR
jgi:NAD(P)-dependent dehydrogenase (short-subunit alcohol dehydrogenase family)